MMRVILLGALVLKGCTPHPTEASLDSDFVLAIGQSVHLAGTSTTVTFEAVPQDSRCPTNVQCVWAGNAEVRLRIATGNSRVETSLNTGVEPRSASAAGVQIELVEVTPAPVAGSPAIPAGDYRARLRARSRP
jgi:hypothetical protein